MEGWRQYGDRIEAIFHSILRESERGAVLLSCHIIDDFLAEQIRNHKNPLASAKVVKDTFGYGGAFGSLSMKCRSLFVLGVLTEQCFGAIEKLRSIRNKAAHSAEEFSLANYDSSFQAALHKFGEDDAVAKLSFDMALSTIVDTMLKAGQDLAEELGANPFPNEEACKAYLAENPGISETFDDKLPRWRLATLTYLIVETIGLSFRRWHDRR